MNHAESKLQAAICQALQARGVYFFSVANEAAGRSTVAQMQLVAMGLRAGASDLVVVLPGRVVFMEVKAPDGEQSDKQIKFQAEVEERGHKYVVVRSVEEAVDSVSRI